MLSDRRQQVLSALIEEYVARALPVGSRTLVDRYDLGVSPATVRNELSVLEEAGYITQPHTSAGRIPTDFGYRAFVDSLFESGVAEESEIEEKMIDDLRSNATELDDLLAQTSAALSRLTDSLSIILAPSIIASQIKQLSLVSLSETQVLIVIITEDGQVLNRHLEFREKVDCDELGRIQNLLGGVLIGKSLADVHNEASADTIKALQEPLVQVILEEVVLCLKESKGGRTHRLGVSSLLTKPEFSHSQSLLPIMQVLEDETVLLHIFEEEGLDQGTVVKIGSENVAEGLSGVSVVAGQYGRGDAAGVVAVIGPTRMDYSKVLKAVHAVQQTLQDV